MVFQRSFRVSGCSALCKLNQLHCVALSIIVIFQNHPQIFFSLLLGAWFSDVRLRLKGSRFFKTVIDSKNTGK